eukprot:Nk52_evm14s967 gene=Nk52_evmTU14s967
MSERGLEAGPAKRDIGAVGGEEGGCCVEAKKLKLFAQDGEVKQSVEDVLARRLDERAAEEPTHAGAVSNDIEQVSVELCNQPPNSNLLFSLLGKRAELYSKLGKDTMALADATSALSLNPKYVKGWLLKGSCHFIKKQYAKAIEAFERGLELEPSDIDLNDSLTMCQSVMRKSDVVNKDQLNSNCSERKLIANHAVMSTADVLDCPLCLKLLSRPSLLPCGHSFCQSCLERTLDYDRRCPLCREAAVMQSGPLDAGSLIPNITLQNLLVKQYPKQTKEREEEIRLDKAEGSDGVPLFVLDSYVVPNGVFFPMMIFEPRYKLFVRRCLEMYDGVFGLVYNGSGDEEKMSNVGVLLKIVGNRTLDDGRYLINTKSEMRFYIEKKWQKDEYWMGKVVELKDEPIEGYPLPADIAIDPRRDTQECPAMQAAYYERFLRSMVRRFDGMVKSSNGSIKESVWERFGRMPTEAEGLEKFSLWFAAITTLTPEEKQCLLVERNTIKRLEKLYITVKSSPRSCALM